MKVEVDLTEYGVKAPKWYDPINPHIVNASGGSGSKDVELTLEEYEALSEEEKMNGTNYFITDIGNPKSLSKKVLFDNTVVANTTYDLADDILSYDYIIAYVYPSTSVRIANPLYFNNSDLLKIVGNTNNDFLIGFVQSTSNALQVLSVIPTSTTFKPYVIYNVGFQGASAHVVLVGYRYERVIVPNQMVNYSTVEARIGTWIDGKPLYQRSFAFNYSDLNTSGTIKYSPAINSSMISDLKETVDIDGILITNNYGPIPIGCKGYAESNITSIYIEVSKYYTRIGIIAQGINLQNEFNKLYVTVRYTKTTD